MGFLKLTNESFKERARQIHGNKYDYSRVEYGKNNKEKVCIICPEHGEFWQRPNRHLSGDGCPYCCKNKKLTQEEFIERVNLIYNYKYDFSKSVYTNTDTKVKCLCSEHGEFWQTPHHLLQGVACERCGTERASKIKIEYSAGSFEEKARKVHGDKYDYSKVKYINCNTKVCIICPEHGEFWQKPVNHLQGNGCPICNNSHIENKIMNFLEYNDIEYIKEMSFKWLGKQHLDFYLPEYNIAIECQGEQHFKPIKHFGGEKAFLKRIKLDENKNSLCKKNGIKVLYFSEKNYPGMITDIDELKKLIK